MTQPSQNIDFSGYKQSLIDFLRTKPQFTDYDFEGTNFSVLVALLTYNAENYGHYGNMVGTEAWNDTAQIRSSLVSHAKDLNYLPRSRVSAHAQVDVEVIPNDTPTSIILPKNYRFRSTDPNGNQLYFVTDREYVTVADENGQYIFNEVDVYEGTIVEEFYDVTDTYQDVGGWVGYNQTYMIMSPNIDVSSLEVYIRDTPTSPTRTKYNRALTLQGLNSGSEVFFVHGYRDDHYQLQFGDNIFGKALTNGNVIEIVYRNTQGATVQGNYTLSRTADVAGYANVNVLYNTRVQGGFERENNESIRYMAPKHFQAQDRGVTSYDYESLIAGAFPGIQKVHAFGGEEIYQYGKIIIVLKPFGTSGIVSNSTKSQIIQFLKTKQLVHEPVIIDPQYFYLTIVGSVDYIGTATSLTKSEIESRIVTKIEDLNNGALGNFDVDVYQTLITDAIKSADLSITGASVILNLVKRWQPIRNQVDSFVATINNPIYKSRDGAYRTPDDYAVRTTPFNYFNGEETVEALVQDDGVGNLNIYTIASGNLTKFGNNIGTVDYDNGIVKFNLEALDYTGFIGVSFKLAVETIRVKNDNFVIASAEYINLQVNKK